MPAPAVIRTVADLRTLTAAWRAAGARIGLVPTMGALHAGHLELVREARRHADRVAVSIFVNPTQFAPSEDLATYPRTFEADLALLGSLATDLVWAPSPAEMYRDGFATRVVPAGAAEGLESDFRPHFFGGVATVCCKLFTQVGPDIAVFGEKDYQQLCVVRQMVRDLDLPLAITGVPTVREADGLAMSSRNRYLTADERAVAPALHRVIAAVAASARTDVAAALARGRRDLDAAGFKVDYLDVRNAQTLRPVTPGSGEPMRVLAAAWLGKTRLIDNVAVA